MDYIYIEVFQEENENIIAIPIESALIVILYKYFQNPQNITLKIIQNENKNKYNVFDCLKFKNDFLNCIQCSREVELTHGLKPPFYIHDKDTFISGFSAVSRQLIINSPSKEYDFLLGFNKSCLQAPAEMSSWTKFCEINVMESLKKIVEQFLKPTQHIFEIPDAFQQFHRHLQYPLKINDKYKMELRKSKTKVTQNKFSEYNHPTVVDIIIFLSFKLSFEFLSEYVISKMLTKYPLLSKWIEDVCSYDKKIVKVLDMTKEKLYKNSFNSHSKYEQAYLLKEECAEIFNKINQTEKYKQISKVQTVQANILKSLNLFRENGLKCSSQTIFDTVFDLDWNKIPRDCHPDYGGLPDTRLERKKQQLKCLINIVMSLVKNGDTIVDFCSGSGHLGIILAELLPACKIIFLENKQYSLFACKKRSAKLNLKNCYFYQSNIDYYTGKFELGLSLHACGSATDIVLLKCIQKNAKFISCPCCYGSINPMPHIMYPMSKTYRNLISERDYLYLTHAADLSIALNDVHCMDVIDTDRKIFAEELGYNCILSRLSPESCSPKNRILIGVPK